MSEIAVVLELFRDGWRITGRKARFWIMSRMQNHDVKFLRIPQGWR